MQLPWGATLRAFMPGVGSQHTSPRRSYLAVSICDSAINARLLGILQAGLLTVKRAGKRDLPIGERAVWSGS